MSFVAELEVEDVEVLADSRRRHGLRKDDVAALHVPTQGEVRAFVPSRIDERGRAGKGAVAADAVIKETRSGSAARRRRSPCVGTCSAATSSFRSP